LRVRAPRGMTGSGPTGRENEFMAAGLTQAQAKEKAAAEAALLKDLTPFEREMLDKVLSMYSTLSIEQALAMLRLGGM
jgi:hypothetical protein